MDRHVKRIPTRDIESVAIAGDRILAVAYWHEDPGAARRRPRLQTYSRCGMDES